MDPTQQPYVTVFRSPDRGVCAELGLVLHAVHIPARIVVSGDGWLLLVPEVSSEEALREIADYRHEDPGGIPVRTPAPLGGGAVGVAGYVSALLLVAALARRFAFGTDWVRAGRLHAGLTMDGEWWRCVTALTLHANAAHLVANLAFGTVFGLLVTQALGAGATWLAILLSGILGNALNALLQPATHSAIGASTSVFGGLGILVALAFDRRRGRVSGRLRWASPVIAAFLILVYTGIGGERTDVLAHVTGLLAGLLVGLGAARIPRRVLVRPGFQLATAGIAGAIICLAWSFALAS